MTGAPLPQQIRDRLGGIGQPEEDHPPVPPPRGGQRSTTDSVSERLERKYGLGSSPRTRRAFFKKLERLALMRGQAVIDLITAADRQSDSAQDHARYFCATIKGMLIESGYWPRPRETNRSSW